MINHMKTLIDVCGILYRSISNKRLKELAKKMQTWTYLLMLHTLFLLDFEILENGKFVPSYVEDSISQAIFEVVEMV